MKTRQQNNGSPDDNPHPTFVDSDHQEKTIDWVHCLRAAAVPTFAGDICVHRYSNPALYGNIAGASFRGYIGSKCFLETNNPTPIVPTPSMLDEAWTAVNYGLIVSGKETIEGNFANYHFVTEPVLEDGRVLARAMFRPLLPDVDMNLVGRCLLCDQIAELMLGRAVSESSSPGGRAGRMRWAFESERVARNYVLVCVFLTTGTTDYYLSLHKRAERFYNRSLRAATAVLEGNQGRARLQAMGNTTNFAVGFGDEKSGDAPFFYLIGNLQRNPGGRDPNRKRQIYSHDFCIVIPDLAFFREHRNTTNTRARRAAGHGRALYFRPVVGSDSGTTE